MVLEAACYAGPSCFFTLTYAPKWLPPGGNLVPEDLKAFRLRLRYLLGGGFRYYFVGEYGERSFRPHYHGVLFGVMPTLDQLESAWSVKGELRGGVHLGVFTVDAATYVAGYVTKKWTKADHPDLFGRHPEFSRMSRRPGIGARGLQGVVDWLRSSDGEAYLQRERDVPIVVRFNGKIFPLGRYLVERLRLVMGIDVADRDPVRALKKTLLHLEHGAPELMAMREFKRENNYRKAVFYSNLRRAKEKL